MFTRKQQANDELFDTCMELRSELHQTNARVVMLEKELAEAKMERSRAIAHERVMMRNERLTRGSAIPSGDVDEGYSCPVPGCGAPVHFPFEQRHCMNCGVEFDWSPTSRQLYDRGRDYEYDKALGAVS